MHKKRRLAKVAAITGLALVMTTGVSLASKNQNTATANSASCASYSTVAPLLEKMDGWYKTSYGDQAGYVSADWLNVTCSGQTILGQGTVLADALNVHSGPGAVFTPVGLLSQGTVVAITENVGNGWYKVSGGGCAGYVSAEGVEAVGLEAAAAEPVAMAEVSDPAVTQDAAEPAPSEAVAAEPVAQPEIPSEPIAAGYVNTDCLLVRDGADTSATRVGCLYYGASVSILQDCGNGWYLISYGDSAAYVYAAYISQGEPPVVESTSTGYVATSALNVRSGAGTSYSPLGMLYIGDSVTIYGQQVDGWYKISYKDEVGYVSAQYISDTPPSIPSAPAAPSAPSAPADTSTSNTSSSSSLGEKAVALAKAQLGKPYVYGAAGPNSFDCSGLTYYIFNQLGLSLSRTASNQYRNNGTFVSADEMQPGDLVFLYDPRFDSSGGALPTTHVMMYVGNNTVLHASTTSYTVQYDTLFGGYYGNYVVGIKRMG